MILEDCLIFLLGQKSKIPEFPISCCKKLGNSQGRSTFFCHFFFINAQLMHENDIMHQLAIPKLMRGLGTSVKKVPKLRNEPNHYKKTTSKLVSMQSLKTFT